MPADELGCLVSGKKQKIEAWRRHTLCAISIALLGAGLALSSFSTAGETEFLRGVFLKSGIVLFMLWLALPQLERLNWWALLPVVLTGFVAVVRPQLILVAARIVVPLAPILFLIWMIRKPKSPR